MNPRNGSRGLFWALSAAYASISFVAFVQLIRIQLRVPEYGWMTQKVFHLMNFIVNGLRAVSFGLYKDVFKLRLKARSQPVDKLRPSYYAVNTVVYFIQVCIWIYVRLSHSHLSVEVAKLFFSAVSFIAALAFLVYGGRLFVMLRRFPIESRGRRKKLNEAGFVMAICFTCFLIRCFVVALSAFDKEAELDVLNHPILNLIYYTLVEILPSALVLFILRKLPPKRISDQYHPIR